MQPSSPTLLPPEKGAGSKVPLRWATVYTDLISEVPSQLYRCEARYGAHRSLLFGGGVGDATVPRIWGVWGAIPPRIGLQKTCVYKVALPRRDWEVSHLHCFQIKLILKLEVEKLADLVVAIDESNHKQNKG